MSPYSNVSTRPQSCRESMRQAQATINEMAQRLERAKSRGAKQEATRLLIRATRLHEAAKRTYSTIRSRRKEA